MLAILAQARLVLSTLDFYYATVARVRAPCCVIIRHANAMTLYARVCMLIVTHQFCIAKIKCHVHDGTCNRDWERPVVARAVDDIVQHAVL